MAKNNMTAFDILMSRSGRKTTGAKNTAQEDIQKIGSSANEFQNALISTLSQPSRATDGPAQVQTPSQPVQAPAIQTPELDSFRNNATGNTWEDTNALARQLDAEKAREAELQKTPERNVGGGLTTRQFEQAHGERDFTTGDVLANAGRRFVGDTLGGVRNTINYYGSYVPAAIAETVKDPSKSPNRLEQFQYDFDSDPHAMDAYNAWKASLKPGEYEALEMSGQLPDPRSLYAQQRLQQMSDEYQKDYVEPELKSIVDFGRGFQAETEEKYGNMTGLGGVIGDLAGTIGQMSPAMALNRIPYVGPVASTAYLLGSAAGNATEQAYANGASLQQAVDYGTMSGAVEAATEKMFDGMAGLLGKGAADDIVESVIGKLTSGSGNNALRNALRLGFGALGEGAEEGISGIVDPLLRTIYNNKGLIESYKDLDQKDLWYQIMLGALSGGVLGSIGMVNGQFAGKNAELEVNRVARQIVDDYLANTPEGQATVERVENSPVGENTTQTQAPADDRLFHEPVNRSTANRILFDPEQRAAFEAETGVSLSNMSIRDAANLIMEYSRQSAETGQTGFDVAYPIKTPQAPKQFDHALTRSEAMLVANDPTLRTLFEQETGRTIPGKKYAVQFIQNVTAQLAEQANAPAQPTSPIAQTVLQNEAQQQAQAPAPQEQTPAQQPAPAPIPAQNRAAPARPEGQTGQVRSISESNTVQAVDAQNNAPASVRQEIYYNPVSEDKSVSQARAMLQNGYQSTGPATPNTALTTEQRNALTAAGQRLGGGYGQAIADMQGTPVWTGVQQDMSLLMFDALAQDARQTGNWDAYLAWRQVDAEHGQEIARALQARGKATRGVKQDLMDYVADTINASNLSDGAKTEALDKTLRFAEEYSNIDRENADALRDLIKRISDERNTGTIIKPYLDKLLAKQGASYLASIAEAQVKGMANDYIPSSVGDKVKSYQTIAQLLKLTTFERNLFGNETFGFMDAMVGNVFGVALDRAVSGATNARSVGFDARWLNSVQRKAAIDAMNKSMLEIALDVDMGTVGTKYDPRGRSYKMSGNVAERFMSRLSQILSYSLSSSDAFFRGALEAGTTDALTRLNQGNEAALSQVEGVAQNRASYTLFQNQGKVAQAAKAFHDRLNGMVGFGGEMSNGRRTGGFGLGDLIMPYATVPANLAVKAFEYSPAGIVKGGIEMAKVLRDAKNGKVNLQQQHNAVMDISRGVTGLPVALLFSALIRSGIIKRSKDDDDYDVTQARSTEGRKETQWNLDATLRWLQGGSKEWQEGDKLVSLNWAEPLNAFMDIGALLADAQKDGDATLADYLSNYAVGSIQAAMEMPMVDGLQSAFRAFQNADSDNMWEKVGAFGESTVTSAATGLMPGIVSQIARTIDPTTRDTSGDTFMERFTNAVQNATPLRDRLPEKLDSFGNPITNENPLLNTLNNLVLPGQVAEYAPDKVVQALDSVYDATGKSTFYPDYKAPKSFSYGGTDYELTTDEKRTYQENFGQRYNELMQSVIDSKLYGRMTDAERAEVFGNIRNLAAAEARGEIVTGRGGEYTSDYDKVSELSDIAGYYSTKAMFDTVSDDKHRDYERMPEILDQYGALPDDVKKALDAGGTVNLDKLYNAYQGGVSAENWFKATDATKGLEPYGDSENVKDWQKYQAMANASFSEDMDVILKDYLEDTAYDKYITAREAGISSQDWADARAAAGMLTPPDGKENVPESLQYQAYATVLDDKGMDAMMQAYLDKNAYEKYSVVRGLGVSAKDWADAWATTASLTPLDGKEDVAEWQRYQAMASSASEKTMDAIFRSVMEDGMYARYTSARSGGVTPQQWADTRAAIAQLPILDGKKTVANWQGVNYIGSSKDLTDKEKDAMMALYFDKGQNGKFSTYDKYMACRAAGFKPQHLAKFYEFSCTYSKKADIIAAAVRYGFSQKNAEALYSMWQNGHW